jgi:hypothetical protein
VERAAEKVGAEDFRDPIYRAIYEGLLQVEAGGGRDPDGKWVEVFPPEAQETVATLRGDPEGEHMAAPEAYFAASVRQILSRPYEERLREIDREMQEAGAEKVLVLYREKSQLLQMMRERKLVMKPGVLTLGPPSDRG